MENQIENSVQSPLIKQCPVFLPSKDNFLPILLTGIICSIVFGLGGYLLGKQSPKPQEVITTTAIPQPSSVTTPAISESSADWKVYQSKRFSIQFSYPAKYILDNDYENTYSDQGFMHLYTQEGYELVKSQAGRGGPDFIEVGAYGNPKKLTALEWAESDTAHSNFSGKYETVNIAGENGLSYAFEGMGSGDVRVIAHNGYIYTFDVMGDAAMQADFKRILDTVKFIK